MLTGQMASFYMKCNGGLKWVNLMRIGLTIVFLAKNRSCLRYGCSDWVRQLKFNIILILFFFYEVFSLSKLSHRTTVTLNKLLGFLTEEMLGESLGTLGSVN